MTLRDFHDEAGLMPEVAGITGPLDGWRRRAEYERRVLVVRQSKGAAPVF